MVKFWGLVLVCAAIGIGGCSINIDEFVPVGGADAGEAEPMETAAAGFDGDVGGAMLGGNPNRLMPSAGQVGGSSEHGGGEAGDVTGGVQGGELASGGVVTVDAPVQMAGGLIPIGGAIALDCRHAGGPVCGDGFVCGEVDGTFMCLADAGDGCNREENQCSTGFRCVESREGVFNCVPAAESLGGADDSQGGNSNVDGLVGGVLGGRDQSDFGGALAGGQGDENLRGGEPGGQDVPPGGIDADVGGDQSGGAAVGGSFDLPDTAGSETSVGGLESPSLIDGDGDGIGVIIDIDDSDPSSCLDLDLDGCDDCASGRFDLGNDGADFDGDGLCDIGDPDTDGDGVSNETDTEPMDSGRCGDIDGDSCEDCRSGVFDVSDDGDDLDSDGLCNQGDPDRDGDGVSNEEDSHPLDKTLCGDDDQDGCDDCASGLYDPENDGADTDNDGICDTSDADDDGDGVSDEADVDPLNPLICGDSENGGVGDGCDDCAVTGQSGSGPNASNDGADSDNDGICDLRDNCPNVANSNQAKTHALNISSGDACVDQDADGVPFDRDRFDLDSRVCVDADGDGCDDCSQADSADPLNDGIDTDQDGVCDSAPNGQVDNCPTIFNPDQQDSDGDGLGEPCDLGTIVTDRVGRPLINTLLIGTFYYGEGDGQSPQMLRYEVEGVAAKDEYNQTDLADIDEQFDDEFYHSLPFLDGLDEICGNGLFAGDSRSAHDGNPYTSSVIHLKHDVLIVDRSAADTAEYSILGDSNGRRLSDDVVDTTLTLLVGGDSSQPVRVSDVIGSEGKTYLDHFPFLSVPTFDEVGLGAENANEPILDADNGGLRSDDQLSETGDDAAASDNEGRRDDSGRGFENASSDDESADGSSDAVPGTTVGGRRIP